MAINIRNLENYVQKWNWTLEIDGYPTFNFTKADRPKAEFETVTISPGGTHRDQKYAGRVSFEDLSFEAGVLTTQNNSFLEWMQETLAFGSGQGTVPSDYKKTIDMVEFDQTGAEVGRFRLYGAWIKGYDGGDLDGSASEIVMDTLTVVYDYFSKA